MAPAFVRPADVDRHIDPPFVRRLLAALETRTTNGTTELEDGRALA
jgi:hypothetical protein